MNNKEMELLRLLELIKYETLLGKSLDHSNTSSQYTYHAAAIGVGWTANLELETPEDLTFKLDMVINYAKKATSSYKIKVNWNNSGTGVKMKESAVYSPPMGYNLKCYTFESEEFKKLSLTVRQQYRSTYSTDVASGKLHGLQFSVIVIVQTQGVSDFEKLMNMDLSIWNNHFNSAVNKAKNDDIFKFLDRYHRIILRDKINATDRIAILKKLANDFWGTTDTDEVEESKLFADLLEYCPETDVVTVYDAFFTEGAKLYRDVFSTWKLNYSSYKKDRLRVLIFLLKGFYEKKTEADLEEIFNDILNYPENKIIPIIHSTWLGTLPIGPFSTTEDEPGGIKLKKLEIWEKLYLNEHERRTIPKAYKMSNGKTLNGTEFKYDEMLLGLCYNDGDALGLTRGRIYPLPAFAMFKIDIMLSKNYTFWDLLSDYLAVSSIIMPFFKVVQGINVGLNLFKGSVAFASYAVDKTFDEEMKKSTDGKRLVFALKFISEIYGSYGLYEKWKKYRFFMLKDFESLQSLYGRYKKTQYFINLTNNPDTSVQEGLQKLEQQINKYDDVYKKIKGYEKK